MKGFLGILHKLTSWQQFADFFNGFRPQEKPTEWRESESRAKNASSSTVDLMHAVGRNVSLAHFNYHWNEMRVPLILEKTQPPVVSQFMTWRLSLGRGGREARCKLRLWRQPRRSVSNGLPIQPQFPEGKSVGDGCGGGGGGEMCFGQAQKMRWRRRYIYILMEWWLQVFSLIPAKKRNVVEKVRNLRFLNLITFTMLASMKWTQAAIQW